MPLVQLQFDLSSVNMLQEMQSSCLGQVTFEKLTN
jgi:hypothetical protein